MSSSPPRTPPDSPAASLVRTIGTRVRGERSRRGWTLDQLAAASGISRRMLVNIEQAGTNPSIGTLLRLSSALGLSLPALVDESLPAAVSVTRGGEGAVLWSSTAGGAGVLVAGSESPDILELWDWTLGPGDEHRSEPHEPGTRELLHVHEGVVRVEVDGAGYDLAPGDALAFPGDVPHGYVNPGERAARYSLTVSEPGPGRSR